MNKTDLTFASSHFLPGSGKCGRLHGHNYHLQLLIKGSIDDRSILIDFRQLKKLITPLISKLDHKVLIPKKSAEISINNDSSNSNIDITVGKKFYSFPREDVVFVPVKATTCEELCIYFFEQIKALIPDLKIKVVIEETPGNSAMHSDADFS